MRTAELFQAWVTRVAPGTRVVICGGVAAWLHGGSRITKDLATTLDFSKCTVPADIDTLKTYMRRSPRFTVKGVDTLYHLDAKISIPVDYVDANVFYFPPHKADVLVVPVPSKSSLQVLSAPTLLVHKVIATQDRPITELVLRLTKQLVDATDAQYLIHKCLQSWQLIQPIHARRFKGDAQRILSAFTAVSRSVQVCNDRDFAAWNALVSASGLSSAFRITNSSGFARGDESTHKELEVSL